MSSFSCFSHSLTYLMIAVSQHDTGVVLSKPMRPSQSQPACSHLHWHTQSLSSFSSCLGFLPAALSCCPAHLSGGPLCFLPSPLSACFSCSINLPTMFTGEVDERPTCHFYSSTPLSQTGKNVSSCQKQGAVSLPSAFWLFFPCRKYISKHKFSDQFFKLRN